MNKHTSSPLSTTTLLLHALVSLSFAVLHFVTLFLCMYGTRPNTTNIYTTSIVYALSSLSTLIFLYAILLRRKLHSDAGLFLGIQFFDMALCALHWLRIPAGVFIGGVILKNMGESPVLGWILGGSLAALYVQTLQVSFWVFKGLWRFVSWFLSFSEEPKTSFIRGALEISKTAGVSYLQQSKKYDEELLNWADLPLPEHYSKGHFTIVGTTRSAKTVCMRLLMQSVLPRIRQGSDQRALIYDAKGDFLPAIAGMGISCPVEILNPFDARSAAWDIAADIVDDKTAEDISHIFIQKLKDEKDPFWSNAARGLMKHTLIGLNDLFPGDWSLRDLIHIMMQHERNRVFLESCPYGDLGLEWLNGKDHRTVDGIIKTVLSNMDRLSIIAGLWHNCNRRVSLRHWSENEYILVLGSDGKDDSALAAINRAIFLKASQLINREGLVPPKRRTWFFIDEAKRAARLEGLDNLITESASRGGRVVIAFQSIEGLRTVWNPHEANEISGIPTNKLFLKMGDEETAKWACGHIGRVELWEEDQSHQERDSVKTIHRKKVIKDAVLESELTQGIPLPTNEEFTYFLTIAGLGFIHDTCRLRGFLNERADQENSFFTRPDGLKISAHDFIPRNPSHQKLSAWSENDENKIFSKPKERKMKGKRDLSLELDKIKRMKFKKDKRSNIGKDQDKEL